MSLVDQLKAVTEKEPYSYNKKDCSGYLLTLWMSHDPQLIDKCADINPYIYDLPDELIFRYFVKCVPIKKRYLKWTKKSEQSVKKEDQIKELMEEYGLSLREAKLSAR